MTSTVGFHEEDEFRYCIVFCFRSEMDLQFGALICGLECCVCFFFSFYFLQLAGFISDEGGSD